MEKLITLLYRKGQTKNKIYRENNIFIPVYKNESKIKYENYKPSVLINFIDIEDIYKNNREPIRKGSLEQTKIRTVERTVYSISRSKRHIRI